MQFADTYASGDFLEIFDETNQVVGCKGVGCHIRYPYLYLYPYPIYTDRWYGGFQK